MNRRKLILVTGAHRSGSTWTGKIISRSLDVRYVHEPFNIAIKEYNPPFSLWFQHINSDYDPSYQSKVKKYLSSFLFGSKKTSRVNLINLIGPKIKSLISTLLPYNSKKTLIKDPLALMSTEWIYNNFDCKVIIMIRHPAAFIASIKVKNWKFDFNHFNNQPELIKTYLREYEEVIEQYSIQPPDIIDQGILLWKCLYKVVFEYQKRYQNEWYFLKHESLSLDPLNEFGKIFNFLELDFDHHISQFILESSESQLSDKLRRNSKENISTWKKRLSKEEINQIKSGTSPIWQLFYTEDDW